MNRTIWNGVIILAIGKEIDCVGGLHTNILYRKEEEEAQMDLSKVKIISV